MERCSATCRQQCFLPTAIKLKVSSFLLAADSSSAVVMMA